MDKGYVISWKSKVTGHRDSGVRKFSFDDAQSYCRDLNRRWGEINHYEVFEGE